MTYKNIKFDESAVMRSLEKLAIKKGLVQPETITKVAAAKASLKPTENFEENILKLCSALRSSGFERHASEVEDKFFNLKRAQAYTVHNETGEDLVNAAHPEGSHQMKDVAGKAVFHTVVDRQKAIQDMIAKKPTGKLAATLEMVNQIKKAGKTQKESAINAIKVILAQAQVTPAMVESACKSGASILDSAMQLAKSAGGLSSLVLKWAEGRQAIVQNVAMMSSSGNITTNNVDEAISAINAIQRNFHPNALNNVLPSWLNKGISEDDTVWEQVNGKLEQALSYFKNASSLVKQIALRAANPEPEKPSAPVSISTVEISDGPFSAQFRKLWSLTNKLKNAKVVGSVATNKQVMQWIDEEIATLQSIYNRYSTITDEEQEKAMGPSLAKEINAEEVDINNFYQSWVANPSEFVGPKTSKV